MALEPFVHFVDLVQSLQGLGHGSDVRERFDELRERADVVADGVVVGFELGGRVWVGEVGGGCCCGEGEEGEDGCEFHGGLDEGVERGGC